MNHHLSDKCGYPGCSYCDYEEDNAASQITVLRAQVATLREALDVVLIAGKAAWQRAHYEEIREVIQAARAALEETK